MIGEPQIPFSDMNPNRLRILLAGRALTHAEAVRWQQTLNGGRRTLPLLGLGLLLFFSLQVNRVGTQWWEQATFYTVLCLCLVGLIVGTVRLLGYQKQRDFCAFNEYAADTARHAAGYRLAFYEDRLTVTSLRGMRTLRFDQLISCVETYDGFALSDTLGCVVVRSQDMMEYDVHYLRAYLRERVNPRVWRVVSPVRAWLTQPLPLPVLPPLPAPLTRAVLPSAAFLQQRENARRFSRFLQLCVPLWLFGGIMTTSFVSLTPWFLADLGLFCLSWLAIGWLFTLFMYALLRPRITRKPLELAFEPDGLRITNGESTRFVVKERLWLEAGPNGVAVHGLDDRELFIPFNAVENVDVLKALAGME